jgi:3-oxoacyl-[acyl-carrier-protein] synthase-3
MDKDRIGIIGLGHYLPDKVLSNSDLEKMVDTSDEWITTRTGIKQRRLVEKGTATSDIATIAAQEALKDANLKPEELDLIIVATITPDMQFPSTACLVQAKIGALNAAAFDVSAACSGFIYAIAAAYNFILSGQYKNALVIGAEVLSSIVDWQDRNTCVLFGDGAGAAVLTRVADGGILSVHLGSDGNSAGLLNLPAGGSAMPATIETVTNRQHYLKMSGNEVFKLAVKAMADAADKAAKKAGITKVEDINLIIPHQANMRILMAVANRLKLSESQLFLNVEKYGNMSSASTAVALYEAVKQGRIKKGDNVILVAFGAGLTWAACAIKW